MTPCPSWRRSARRVLTVAALSLLLGGGTGPCRAPPPAPVTGAGAVAVAAPRGTPAGVDPWSGARAAPGGGPPGLALRTPQLDLVLPGTDWEERSTSAGWELVSVTRHVQVRITVQAHAAPLDAAAQRATTSTLLARWRAAAARAAAGRLASRAPQLDAQGTRGYWTGRLAAPPAHVATLVATAATRTVMIHVNADPQRVTDAQFARDLAGMARSLALRGDDPRPGGRPVLSPATHETGAAAPGRRRATAPAPPAVRRLTARGSGR